MSAQRIDSLQKALKKDIDDVVRADIYNNLSYEYTYSNIGKAKEYGLKALALAKENENIRQEADALNHIGLAYFYSNHFSKALSYYQESQQLYKKINYQRGMAITFNNIGFIYENEAKYDKAINCYFKALDICEKRQDSKDISMCLNNIGNIYFLQDKFKKAEEYYERCLKLDEKINDYNAISASLNNLAMIYGNQGKYDEAISQHGKALIISQKTKNTSSEISSLINLGGDYRKKGNSEKSLEYLLIAENKSKIADGWKIYYDYYLTDSLMLGDDWCYQIEIYPKRPQDLAFEGIIWIDSKTYGLKQVSVTVNRTANINFIEKVKIQQELQKTEAGPWIPIKNRVLIDVAEITNKSAGLLAKFYISNKDLVVNKPYPIKFYREKVIVDANANIYKDDYWKISRHDSLTKEELQTYALIDTIKQVPIVKAYSSILKIIGSGYINAGIIDFGHLAYTYAINDVEGQRFRLGLETSSQFSRKIILKGYLAYGTKDSRFKYSGSIRYIPSRKRWTELVLERSDDLVQVAANLSGVVVPGAYAASLNFFNVLDRSPFYRQENSFYVQSDLFKGFRQTVRLRNASYTQIGNHFAYYKDLNLRETTLERNFSITELTFETRLAKDEQFFYTDNNRYSLGTRKLPVVTLRYTMGLNNFLGGDFQYHRFGIAFEQNLRIGLFGKSYYLLSGTYTPSRIPHPLLEIHLGNRGFFYNFYGYSLMNFMEFASDKHVSLNYEHNFDGLIANRLPLFKKLKWRTFVVANVLYGSLSNANLALTPSTDLEGNPLIKPRSLGNAPYVELGYGLTNIFRFFRVTFVHRATYRESPSARRFGVFLSARFEL